MEITENNIEDYLLSKGIYPNVKGFEFLKRAIMLIFKDPKLRFDIVKGIYPRIAKLENTTPTRVERNIRTAISFTKTNLTNSQFLALAVLELARQKI